VPERTTVASSSREDGYREIERTFANVNGAYPAPLSASRSATGAASIAASSPAGIEGSDTTGPQTVPLPSSVMCMSMFTSDPTRHARPLTACRGDAASWATSPASCGSQTKTTTATATR